MRYSPKLKRVMQRISAILEQEDIGASIILHEPGFSEYLMRYDPSYSCLRVNGGSLKFVATSADFPNETARLQSMSDTVNMLQHFLGVGSALVARHKVAMKALQTHFDIKHDGGTHTSQQEIDN